MFESNQIDKPGEQTNDNTGNNSSAIYNANQNIRRVNLQQLEGKVFAIQDANGTFRPVRLAGNREQPRKRKTLSEGDIGTNINPIHERTKTRMLCQREQP